MHHGIMADNPIQCATHGESSPAFVCNHLGPESIGLGFHLAELDEDDPSPSAWCSDCEIIREAHGGWNEESEKLIQIRLICLRCFELIGVRNTRPETTLDDLADLQWKCGTCDELHTGPALDFGFDQPYYWSDELGAEAKQPFFARLTKQTSPTFLTPDYCSIRAESYFVRGVLRLPIIGSAENFVWGVWGSLSRENFEWMQSLDGDPQRMEIAPMFSWLSSSIAEYPETLSLKMYAHIDSLDGRPWFELERTDHPLSQEYYQGIRPAKVKEIMLARLSKFD
jgi:hypothetical protein